MTSAPFFRRVSESWRFCRSAPPEGGHLQTPAFQMQLRFSWNFSFHKKAFWVKADGFVALQAGKEGTIVDGCISNAPFNLQASFCQKCTRLTCLLKTIKVTFAFSHTLEFGDRVMIMTMTMSITMVWPMVSDHWKPLNPMVARPQNHC